MKIKLFRKRMVIYIIWRLILNQVSTCMKFLPRDSN